MQGKMLTSVEARGSAPNIFGMMGAKVGITVRAGKLVAWTESSRGWVRIGERSWVPLKSVSVMAEVPSLLGNIRRVRFHSEMPEEDQNRGSFGIVRVYAHPKADKPHSIKLDSAYVNSIKAINSSAAFRWLFEHDNTKNFGSHFYGAGYSIPTQGIFMGNQVRVLRTQGNFSQLDGIVGKIPVGMNYFTNPELIHFGWCVGKDGKTISPPCMMAFMPVVNPTGMSGAISGGAAQTEIWIENKWLR